MKYQNLINLGYISHEQLDKALNTIRRSRKTIGDLAKEKGLLTSRDVLKILNIQLTTGQPFGEIAVRLDLLSALQVDELIDEQDHKSMPIITALRMNGVSNDVIESIEAFLSQGVLK